MPKTHMTTSASRSAQQQRPQHHGNNNNDDGSPVGASGTAACETISALGKDFAYPACWQDEQRMQALMSAFKLRELNPLNYDSKMQFWQELISAYCHFRGKAHFSHQELRKSLARGQRLPYCLTTVLDEMHRSKKIRTRADFEYDPVNSWTGWAMCSLVRRPLAWGVHQLKSSIGLVRENHGDLLEYVHLEVMQHFCRQLEVQVVQEQQGKLLHYDALRELIARTSLEELQEDCLRMCLHALHCERKIGLEYIKENREHRIHLVKIPTKKNASIAITETDHAIHNLQVTQRSLHKQLHALEADIHVNDQKARQFVQEGKRLLAKTYLRRKHTLERSHEKRSLALQNIEELLCSVDEAKSHGAILDAYKIGSKALQQVLGESGLTYDTAEEVILDVKETIEQHREVNELISGAHDSGATATSADENEALERELSELLGETVTATPQRTTAAGAAASAAAATTLPVATASTTSTAQTVQTPPAKTVEISDSQLLAMLDALEVEDGSPTKQQSAAAAKRAVAE